MNAKWGFLLFILFGLVFGTLGVYLVQNGSASTSWPTAQGEITQSEMRETFDSDGTEYHTQLRYVYIVNERSYTGSKLSYMGEGTNYKFAQGVLEDYPVGKTVKVYYNPDNPGDAVLEPGTDWVSYLPIVLGAIFALVGLLGLLGILKTTEQPPTRTT